jgi:hypothetical protein
MITRLALLLLSTAILGSDAYFVYGTRPWSQAVGFKLKMGSSFGVQKLGKLRNESLIHPHTRS